jgi:hypothetical protein
MVDCIKIRSQSGKKYIENGNHLHEYAIEETSYLCLGKVNVKAAMLLIGLFENERVVKQHIEAIRNILNEDPNSELGMRLQEQALKKLPKDYARTVEEYITDRTKETLDILDKVETVCAQLKEIVIATTPLRNKSCEEVYPFFFVEH